MKGKNKISTAERLLRNRYFCVYAAFLVTVLSTVALTVASVLTFNRLWPNGPETIASVLYILISTMIVVFNALVVGFISFDGFVVNNDRLDG